MIYYLWIRKKQIIKKRDLANVIYFLVTLAITFYNVNESFLVHLYIYTLN